MTPSTGHDRPRALAAAATPLARVHDVALLDLDGVVYIGPTAVPGAVEHLAAARAAGLRLGYVTNNAARPPGVVASHLRTVGIDLDDSDVVTSAQAAARLVAGLVAAGSPVLVVGGAGLDEAVAEHGLLPVRSLDDDPAAVVQGFHPTVGWELLAEGSYAVAAGLPWVASNLDATVPTVRGRAPGNGALVAVVGATTGATPLVAGKPEPALIEESVLRTGAERPLMVGDRLDTDISGATRYGMPSLLVLTGVTALAELLAAANLERPDFVATDLSGLLTAHPAVETEVVGAAGFGRCSGWAVRVEGRRLLLDAEERSAGPARGLALLRASVAAVWAALDQGTPALDQGTPALDQGTPALDVGAVAAQLGDMMDRVRSDDPSR